MEKKRPQAYTPTIQQFFDFLEKHPIPTLRLNYDEVFEHLQKEEKDQRTYSTLHLTTKLLKELSDQQNKLQYLSVFQQNKNDLQQESNEAPYSPFILFDAINQQRELVIKLFTLLLETSKDNIELLNIIREPIQKEQLYKELEDKIFDLDLENNKKSARLFYLEGDNVITEQDLLEYKKLKRFKQQVDTQITALQSVEKFISMANWADKMVQSENIDGYEYVENLVFSNAKYIQPDFKKYIQNLKIGLTTEHLKTYNISPPSKKRYKIEAQLWYIIKEHVIDLEEALVTSNTKSFVNEYSTGIIQRYKQLFVNNRTKDSNLKERLIMICNKKYRKLTDNAVAKIDTTAVYKLQQIYAEFDS